MKLHIPFTFSSEKRLKEKAKLFLTFIRHKKISTLAENLKNAGSELTREEYLSLLIRNFIFF